MRGRSPKARKYFFEVVMAYKGNDCTRWPYGHDGRKLRPRLFWPETGHQEHVPRCILFELDDRDSMEVKRWAADNGMEAAHSCNNMWCVTQGHVSWKTRMGQVQDKILYGTMNTLRDLTKEQVREIRAARGTTFEIADRFGISYDYTRRIRNREVLDWIPD